MVTYISVQCPHCGNEAARLLVGDAPDPQPAILSPQEEAKLKSIEELPLSCRPYNSIKNHTNIKTVGDLIKYKKTDLLRLDNFGKGSLNEVIGILAEMGLSLAGKPLQQRPANRNGAAADIKA